MRAARTIVTGVWLLGLAAAAAAQATKPAPSAKPTPTIPGHATIYFLRHNGLGSPDILVDGHKVGELAHDTYFVVSQPPGHHVIEIPGSFLATSWQSELDLAGGQSYFLEIGPVQTGAPGMDLLTGLLAGTKGRQLPGRWSPNAAYALFSLDNAVGRAEIAKLKQVTR